MHYKGVNTSEDFIVIAESPEIVKKWRSDKSIAMTEVVNAYQIFITGGYVLPHSSILQAYSPHLEVESDPSADQEIEHSYPA